MLVIGNNDNYDDDNYSDGDTDNCLSIAGHITYGCYRSTMMLHGSVPYFRLFQPTPGGASN